jgi:hypothetical protein
LAEPEQPSEKKKNSDVLTGKATRRQLDPGLDEPEDQASTNVPELDLQIHSFSGEPDCRWQNSPGC